MNNQQNGNFYNGTMPYGQQGINMPPPVQQKNKKNIVPVLIAVFAFLICAIGVVAGILIFTASDSSGRIVELLEDGEYNEAYDLYEKKYGKGESDEKLEDALYNRLLDLEDEYADGEITQKKALKEVETIEKMDIEALESDISQTKEYIEKLNTSEDSATTSYTPYTPPSEALGPEDLGPPVTPATPSTPSENPRISSATTISGSVLAASNEDSRRSFGAEKAIDGSYDSCWCVNTSSSGGAGATIKFTLTEKSYVHGIRIINGNNFHPSEDIYRSNGQVKSFTLKFSDGTTKTFTASYNGTASNVYEDFAFDYPVATESITLTVNSGYVGAKYTTNVCLGEFAVY